MNAAHIKLYKYFCAAIFCLILLGGSVRAMNAGLSCPDWPLCFGRFIPNYQPQVYFEFIHRVLAGLISIAAVYLNFRIIFERSIHKSIKWVAGGALILLIAQIIMGGLTVLLKLKYGIVTGHLALGTAFFSLSFWAYLSLKENEAAASAPARTVAPTIVLVAAIYGQILLGGLVASNYAGLVCPNFPLCEGKFIPTLHGLIGLQVIHRLGAYTLATIIIFYSIYVLTRVESLLMRRLAKVLVALVVLQICVGVANVKFLTPPLITVLHLGVAVSLLAIGVRLLHFSASGCREG